MPTLDATTTAAFSAAGVDPSTLYGIMQYIAGYCVAVMIWIFKALLPFWLILGVLGLVGGIVFAFVKFGRHG